MLEGRLFVAALVEVVEKINQFSADSSLKRPVGSDPVCVCVCGEGVLGVKRKAFSVNTFPKLENYLPDQKGGSLLATALNGVVRVKRVF